MFINHTVSLRAGGKEMRTFVTAAVVQQLTGRVQGGKGNENHCCECSPFAAS